MIIEDGLTKFNTGAIRSDDRADVRFDLLSPIAMKSWAETSAEGAKKYGAHNWERGMPVSDLLNHVIAHLYFFLGGDRTEDHLGHAMWGVAAAIHSHTLWPHLNGDLRGPGCSLTDAIRSAQELADAAKKAV